MSARRAHPKWGGRTKGTPNKVTASAREAIELAFEGLGGVPALTAWAKDNQTDFFTRIWPKLLPLQISGDPENPLIVGTPPPAPEKPSATMEWLREQIEQGRKSEAKWLEAIKAEIRAEERARWTEGGREQPSDPP